MIDNSFLFLLLPAIAHTTKESLEFTVHFILFTFFRKKDPHQCVHLLMFDFDAYIQSTDMESEIDKHKKAQRNAIPIRLNF